MTGANNIMIGNDIFKENLFESGESGDNVVVGNLGGLRASGSGNTFLGIKAGINHTGNYNTFVGFNTTGQYNEANNSGSGNTLLGTDSSITANNIQNSTAIGYLATVSTSNTIVLGTTNETVVIPGKLKVDGDASFNSLIDASSIFIRNYSSLNGKLKVGGDASFNSNVDVSGTLLVRNYSSLNGKLKVDGDASFNSFVDASSIIIKYDSSLNGKLKVGGDASFNSLVDASSIVIRNYSSLNGKLKVDGDASFNSFVDVSGRITVNKIVNGSTTEPNLVCNYFDTSSDKNSTISFYNKLKATNYNNSIKDNDMAIISGGKADDSAIVISNHGTVKSGLRISTDASTNSQLGLYCGDSSIVMTKKDNIESIVVDGDATFNSKVDIIGNLTAKIGPDSSNNYAYLYGICQSGVSGNDDDFNSTNWNYASKVTSIYDETSGNTPFGIGWYNLINTRHNGGIPGEGNKYGCQIVTGMYSTEQRKRMTFRCQAESEWDSWNEIAVLNNGLSQTFTSDISFNSFVDASSIVIRNNTSLKGNANIDGSLNIDGYGYLNNNGITETSLVNKGWIEALVSTGVKPTQPCLCATIYDISLNTYVEQVDGIDISNNTRVLVRVQDSSINNGIYVYHYNNSGDASFSRATDCSDDDDVAGQLTFIQKGTIYESTIFVQSSTPGVVGDDELIYNEFYAFNYDFSLGYGLDFNSGILSVDTSLNQTTYIGAPGTSNDGIYWLDSGSTGKLKVGGDSSFNSLIDASSIVIRNYSSLNGKLKVGGDASFNSFVDASSIIIKYDSSLNGKLKVGGDSSFNSLIDASSIVIRNYSSLNGKLKVDGDASFNSNVDVSGTLLVRNNTLLNGKLKVDGDASFNSLVDASSIVIRNYSSLNGKLKVDGDASFNSFIDASSIIIKYDSSLNGKLKVGGDASFNSLVDASSIVIRNYSSLNGKLKVGGDASFNSFVDISGTLTVKNTDAYVNGLRIGRGNNNLESNIVFGNNAGTTLTDGSYNILIGKNVGTQLTTGSLNIIMGINSGNKLMTGGNNIMIGNNIFNEKLFESGDNVVVGNLGGLRAGGSGNTFLGINAGINYTGNYNTFVGFNTTFFNDANNSGSYNTLLGTDSSITDNNIENSTAIGYKATVDKSNTIVLGTTTETVEIPGKLNAQIGPDASNNYAYLSGICQSGLSGNYDNFDSPNWNYASKVTSIYAGTDDNTPFGWGWYNLINTRHNGGIAPEGNKYGCQIVTGMYSTEKRKRMTFRCQADSSWDSWNEIAVLNNGLSQTFTSDVGFNKKITASSIQYGDSTQQSTAYTTLDDTKLQAIGNIVSGTMVIPTPSLSTGVGSNVAALDLTVGTWIISVNACFSATNPTIVSFMTAGYSTLDASYSQNNNLVSNYLNNATFSSPAQWILATSNSVVVTTNTTYYMLTSCTFGTSDRIQFVSSNSDFKAIRIA
jgi:cytoskeletal protein CcmA (bactofilin family)